MRPDYTSPRLFVIPDLGTGAIIPLDRAPANYLVNVLRLGEGAAVLMFNGRDGEWRASLRFLSRKAVELVVGERTRPQPVLPRLTYAFAPLKHARLDYMVQKAVEMGAGVLQPVFTRRTQATRINLDRMVANAVEAAEQCGVLHVPEVRADARLEVWLADRAAGDTLVFCDEDAETADPAAALGRTEIQGPLSLLIGPEGGFAEDERQLLLAQPRVVRLSLGPRILRADTAAVAALAVIQATVGDWRSPVVT